MTQQRMLDRILELGFRLAFVIVCTSCLVGALRVLAP